MIVEDLFRLTKMDLCIDPIMDPSSKGHRRKDLSSRRQSWESLGQGISQNVVWYVVKTCCERVGSDGLVHPYPVQSRALSILRGIMANLENALQQLRAERRQAQLHVEKLDQAISVIESLDGLGTSPSTNQPKRLISAASRRKMALAQKARWAAARKGPKSATEVAKTTGSSQAKRTMSAASRKKIAAFQRARWAKVKAAQKKAA
jgi:hypothetical protein